MLLFPIHTYRTRTNRGAPDSGAPLLSSIAGIRAAAAFSFRLTEKQAAASALPFPSSPANAAAQPSMRFISETTLLSMREICTCDTPMTSATSLCVISRK